MAPESADKILIVDDDELVRQLVRDMVGRLGYEPVSVKSAHDAIGILAVLHPMALLLDLHMPEDPGDECCKVIKSNADLATIPVVFMTGGTSEEDVRRAFFAGADDFLSKPVREYQLSSKLGAIRAGLRQPIAQQAVPPGKTILVADDDQFFRSLVGRVLERAGYRVAYAETGREALELLRRPGSLPDLCVVDLVLPEIGGLDLIRAIRGTATLAHLPIVVVSGFERSRKVLVALRAQGVEVVIDKKTLSVEHVLAEVRAKLFTGRDGRAERRVNFYRTCEFRRHGDPEWLSGFVYDLSSAGVAVRTLTAPPADSVLDLRLKLGPGQAPIVTAATVAWANEFNPREASRYPYGMGLQFRGLGAVPRAWIEDRLESVMTSQQRLGVGEAGYE